MEKLADNPVGFRERAFKEADAEGTATRYGHDRDGVSERRASKSQARGVLEAAKTRSAQGGHRRIDSEI